MRGPFQPSVRQSHAELNFSPAAPIIESMPAWVYDAVEAFVAFMDDFTLLESIVMLVGGFLVYPLVVLIHEAGHALACVLLGQPLHELVVGDDEPLLTIRKGHFQMRLGDVTGKGPYAGFVSYSASHAGPRDVLLIALAGPAASLVGSIVTGLAFLAAWPRVELAWLFGCATLCGAAGAVGNLVPTGTGPHDASDGRWVQLAWRALQEPAPASPREDKHARTSFPPPAQSKPPPQRLDPTSADCSSTAGWLDRG